MEEQRDGERPASPARPAPDEDAAMDVDHPEDGNIPGTELSASAMDASYSSSEEGKIEEAAGEAPSKPILKPEIKPEPRTPLLREASAEGRRRSVFIPKTEIDEHEITMAEEDFSFSGNAHDDGKEFATSEDMLSNCTWELGQLAWARMSIYPFWPCVVTCDPAPIKTFRKVQAKGRYKTLMVHVHFFNDHGRHSWIPSHHMIPFNGIEDFRKRARLVTDVIRKKEPKFAAALSIKPNIFWTWQKAVAEAMDVLYQLDMTPLENFKLHAKETVDNQKDNSLKRKRKSKDGDKVEKKAKSTNSNDSKSSVNNNEIESNLNLDTPPVSPKTGKVENYRAYYNKRQKRIKKLVDKLQPPDFEVFYERNYEFALQKDPSATDEVIRLYLIEMWDGMTQQEKLKYRGTYIVPRDAKKV